MPVWKVILCLCDASALACVAEYVANRVREDLRNPKLKLVDALMTLCNRTDPASDQVYQRVLESVPELQHHAVYTAFKALVESCHEPHHEVLREVSLQYPDLVFQNSTQKHAFDALCHIFEVPLLYGTPAG